MKKQNKPDFFLASSESNTFQGPFMCWVEGEVIGEVRNDYLLVRIEPPAIDFKSKKLLERILIAGRNMQIDRKKLPLTIYILKIKDDSVITSHRCNTLSVEAVATGDIFSSFKAAEELSTRKI